MKPYVRTISTLALASLALTAQLSMAQATYPDHPVKIVVGFAAGGSADVLARLSAQALSKALHEGFVVENRVGASGNIAAELVAKAPPNGYTLMFATTDVTLNGASAKNLPFDPEQDFAPITMVTFAPLVLFTRPGVGGATLKDLIAYVKANPGKISYASTSRGTTTHLAAEQLKLLAGLDMVHVPYKGSSPAMTAVLSGEVDMLFTTYVSAKGLIESGKFRPVAIASATRSPLLPNVPTFQELGYPIEFGTWFGMLAPANTPPAIVDQIYGVLKAAGETNEFKEQIAGLGGELIFSSPSTFRTFIGKDVDKWKKLITAIGFTDLN